MIRTSGARLIPMYNMTTCVSEAQDRNHGSSGVHYTSASPEKLGPEDNFDMQNVYHKCVREAQAGFSGPLGITTF